MGRLYLQIQRRPCQRRTVGQIVDSLQTPALLGCAVNNLTQIYAGMVLVVTHNLAKVKLRVRFPLPAPFLG